MGFPHFSWVFHGFSMVFVHTKMASPTTATGPGRPTGLAACRSGLAVSALPEATVATVGAVATGGAAGRGPERNGSGVVMYINSILIIIVFQ